MGRDGAEDRFAGPRRSIRWPEFDTSRAEAVPILGLGRPISGQLTYCGRKVHVSKSFYFRRFRDL